MTEEAKNGQSGFTMIEVAVASVITMVGLIFLASLFSLAILQNRVVRQFTSTTSLAQEKIEELGALEKLDDRLKIGGDLNSPVKVGNITYSNLIFVDDDTGKVYLDGNIPQGKPAQYRRYWSIQNNPALTDTINISVRVVALQAGRNSGTAEETTLSTVRSW
jgi:Tfp pilus assembly protein PilV